ncbi:MAG TPA: glycosyl transferase family protein [Caulobacteraceae bacterium]|nr:glycosyl transferase family protein [Caulobacteraceae bacterium]
MDPADFIDAVLGGLTDTALWEKVAAGYWHGVHGLLIVVAVAILISSLDDLLIDLCWWGFAFLERVRSLFRPPPSLERLLKQPQSRMAIMVPAWREAEVIAEMVVNTINTFDYDRFEIFVGVYANDPETEAEVERVRERFPNVHRAPVPHDGPTVKADCLNWIVQNIFLHEERTGETFDVFVMHDAEDVVHPYGLRVMNRYVARAGMVQLPVLSMNRPWNRLIACHYMDEFAETHAKDLPLRSAVTGSTPSAGVATAFSRDAMLALCAVRRNQPFNSDSLTEDYDVAYRLKALGFVSRFVRYYAKTPGWRSAIFRKGQVRTSRRELVACKEFFPDRWGPSVRQKARWMLGISYVGWRQLGWFGGLANRYFLFRDRKALATAPIGALAYFVALNCLGYAVLANADLDTIIDLPKPFDTSGWVWMVMQVNLALLCVRLFHRALFTGLHHGLHHIWLTPVRAVVSNVISFAAFVRSMRLFLSHLITGRSFTWDKTQHTYPSLAELKHRSGRLGEVLQFWNHVTFGELHDALRAQKRLYRPLGLLLLDRDAVRDEDLAEAFAEQAGVLATGFNPLAIEESVLGLLSARQSARFLAVPFARTETTLDVALAEPLRRPERQALEALLQPGAAGLRYVFAPRSDIAFTLRHARNRAPLARQQATIDALRRLKLMDEAGLARLLRETRRPYVLLGDLLVRSGALDHRQLAAALERFWAVAGPLGQFLVAENLIDADALGQALAAQAQPPLDLLGMAVERGLLGERDAEQVREFAI